MNLFDTLISSTQTTTPGGAPRITMVPVDHLIEDQTNTRELRDVEALAQGIFAMGLDNPLTVRPAPDSPAGYYKIIAGHRRLAACRLCIEWGDPYAFAINGIPCINKGEQGETAAHLHLILNNRLHREPTGYEEMIETAQLSQMDAAELRQELKLNNPGGAQPAKTRDVIASLLKISPAKTAKYLAIYRHLPPERMEDYKAGRIGTEAAYAVVNDMLKQTRKPKPPAPTHASPAEPTPAPVLGPNTGECREERPQDTAPPGGAAQASGKNQLAVAMHQIAKQMRVNPEPRQIMERINDLIDQHAPAEWRQQMQSLLGAMWDSYEEK